LDKFLPHTRQTRADIGFRQAVKRRDFGVALTFERQEHERAIQWLKLADCGVEAIKQRVFAALLLDMQTLIVGVAAPAARFATSPRQGAIVGHTKDERGRRAIAPKRRRGAPNADQELLQQVVLIGASREGARDPMEHANVLRDPNLKAIFVHTRSVSLS